MDGSACSRMPRRCCLRRTERLPQRQTGLRAGGGRQLRERPFLRNRSPSSFSSFRQRPEREGPSAFARRLTEARAAQTPAPALRWGIFSESLALVVGLALMPVVVAG